MKIYGLLQGNKFQKQKMFVDFQNDVTAKDIKLALKEGFQSLNM